MLLAMLACAVESPELRGESPDVILIALDTVRWDHTSLSDAPHDTTPTLRRLAALPGAVTFTRAYTAASWSLAAYASLFTGLDALTHGLGFTQQKLSPSQPTLAEVLSTYGYQTAAFASGPHLDQANGFSRGFDTWRHEKSFSPLTPQIEPALAWLESARQQPAPYFLFVQGYDAHPPYTAPAVFSEMFSPEYDGDLHLGRGQMRTKECRVVNTRACTPSISALQRLRGEDVDLTLEHDHINTHYDSALRAGDYNLGRLLHGIEQHGALDEAIIVVLSDHGKSFAEGRYSDETARSEQLFHVPLVIRRPSTAPAARWDGVVSLVDVLPTLLDELEMVAPAHASGQSLRSVLDDPTQPVVDDRAVPSAELCCYAVQSEQWELIGDRRLTGGVWTPASDDTPVFGPTQWRLYRHGSRAEVSAEYPEVVASLRDAIAHWPDQLVADPDNINGAAGQDEELRKSLRQHGYWAPTPGEATP